MWYQVFLVNPGVVYMTSPFGYNNNNNNNYYYYYYYY